MSIKRLAGRADNVWIANNEPIEVTFAEGVSETVKVEGVISEDNSSTTLLGGGATFTGQAIEVLDYGIIFVNVYSDVASATNGLVIEQSMDGTNWDHDDQYTVPAATGKNYSINPYARYLRVRYTNGAGAQSVFRLQTILKGNSKPSSHRIQDSISTDDDAELAKAVLTGDDGLGTFRNVQVTQDGYLAISDSSSGLAIAQNLVTGVSFIHKFGQAPDFDTGDGFVTVWDGADDAASWQNMVYDYSASANIDRLSSNALGDAGIDIEVQGLDTNFDIVTQTVSLDGADARTPVALGTSLRRVFRLKNVDSTDLTGYVFCFVNGATTLGVPNNAADIRAIIQAGNNQTLMAVYTIPNGYTGYMRSWYCTTAGAKRDSAHTMKLLSRPSGQVFQLKHISNIAVSGTSYIHHTYVEPEVFSALTDIEIQMDTDQDIAGVAAGFDIVLVAD